MRTYVQGFYILKYADLRLLGIPIMKSNLELDFVKIIKAKSHHVCLKWLTHSTFVYFSLRICTSPGMCSCAQHLDEVISVTQIVENMSGLFAD
jgi:hypothetical protein